MQLVTIEGTVDEVLIGLFPTEKRDASIKPVLDFNFPPVTTEEVRRFIKHGTGLTKGAKRLLLALTRTSARVVNESYVKAELNVGLTAIYTLCSYVTRRETELGVPQLFYYDYEQRYFAVNPFAKSAIRLHIADLLF
jgi:hypothetical protein